MPRLPRPAIDKALLKSSSEVPYDGGNMPSAIYEGIWAHHLIQIFYRKHNQGHLVDTDLSIDRIAALTNGISPHSFHSRIRPDILDRTFNSIWEIKPLRRQPIGSLQLEVYRNALGPNLFLKAGGSGPGTEGKVFAPGGWVSFDCRNAGVIRYQYFRG